MSDKLVELSALSKTLGMHWISAEMVWNNAEELEGSGKHCIWFRVVAIWTVIARYCLYQLELAITP